MKRLSLLFTLVVIVAQLVIAVPLRAAAADPIGSSFHQQLSATSGTIGHVRYIRHGLGEQPPHQKLHPGKVHDSLVSQEALQTKPGEVASIGFQDGTVVHLNESTDALITSHVTQVRSGEVAQYLAPGTSHQVQTAAAVAASIGTTYDLEVRGGKDYFSVLHGALQVQNTAGSVIVKTGQQTIVGATGPPSPPVKADVHAVFAWTQGIPTPDLGEDVSLDADGGHIVNASSQLAGPGGQGDAAHAIDGFLNQGWESATGQVRNQTLTSGFFGDNFYRITGVIIDPAATYGHPASEDLRDFEIRVSSGGTDAASFTTVFRGTCRQSNTLQHFTFPLPIRAKYAQLVALDNYGSSQHVAIAEWEVVANASLFAHPVGIAVDPQGAIFVADSTSNRIDKLSPKGKIIAHWGSKGTGPGQFLSPEGVTLDDMGNIYVVDHLNNRIQKLSPHGRFLTSFGSSGVGPGQFQFPRGIAVDHLGRVYVSDTGGSVAGGMATFTVRVQQFDSNGKLLNHWDDLGDAGSLPSAGGMTVDAQNNLYVADPGANTVLVVSPAGEVQRVIGTPGQLSSPTDVALDNQENVWITEEGSSRITRIDHGGRATRYGGFGYGPRQFVLPGGIAADRQGNIYVADSFNGRLQKLIAASGKVRSIWGKYATLPQFLGQPGGIATDNHGHVFLTDSTNDRIQERDTNGHVLAVVGYHGLVGAAPPTTHLGQFSFPHGIAVDRQGKIYVADTNNSRVQEASPNGKNSVLRAAVKQPAHFHGAWGVTVDRQRNTYVTDAYDNRVKKLSPRGTLLWSVGSQGTGPGQFNTPLGIAVDSAGNVYVSNYVQSLAQGALDSRIEKLAPDGHWLATWGAPDPLGLSRFFGPVGLTIDSHNNLYVADSGHNAVEKLSPSGQLLFVYALPGPNANPIGVAVDTHGVLYVADGLNSRIVKLAPTGEVLGIWH